MVAMIGWAYAVQLVAARNRGGLGEKGLQERAKGILFTPRGGPHRELGML